MSDFNPEEAARLAKELTESADDRYESPTRAMVRSAAEQLRAAVVEVERLRHLSRDIHSIAWAGGRHEARQEDASRIASVEAMCGEACDIARRSIVQSANTTSSHATDDMRITAIRAALAKKETL